MRNARIALVAILLAAAFALAGCGKSASQRWRTFARVYTTTVTAHADLAEAGQIDLADAERFEFFRRPARAYLDRTAASILAGEPAETIDTQLEQIAGAIRALREAMPQGDNQ